jgi:hypothetical protein
LSTRGAARTGIAGSAVQQKTHPLCYKAASAARAEREVPMPRGLKLVKGASPKHALVYGLRLFDSDAIVAVDDAKVKIKDGDSIRVTMHLIEGTKAQIKRQLMHSLDAFFELLGGDE